MSQRYPEFIWQNGEIKRWQDATVHVMAHGLHYGSSVFEGIRSYETPNGPKIFRLTDHSRRLFASAKIYEMPIPYTVEQLNQACRDVIQKNEEGLQTLREHARPTRIGAMLIEEMSDLHAMHRAVDLGAREGSS